MTDYQAAKARMARFMGGESVGSIYNYSGADALRTDLNTIATHEAKEAAPVVRGLASHPEAWPDAYLTPAAL